MKGLPIWLCSKSEIFLDVANRNLYKILQIRALNAMKMVLKCFRLFKVKAVFQMWKLVKLRKNAA